MVYFTAKFIARAMLIGFCLFFGGSEPHVAQARTFTTPFGQLDLILPDWVFHLPVNHSEFGHSISNAGDVNNDGYDDLLVGAWIYDNGQCDEGGIFVFYGSASGPSLTPDWVARVDRHQGRLGSSVTGAGDINGDGIDDIVAGASFFDPQENDCIGAREHGAVFAWYGSSSGLGPEGNFNNADWKVIESQQQSRFGSSVSLGDVNGDGIDDVVVGSSKYDNGQTNEGLISLFLGSYSGPAYSPNWSSESDHSGANLGFSVAANGDVNGDGYDDILAGAPFYTHNYSAEGSAFLYYGSPSLPGPGSRFIDGAQIGAYLGWSVAHVGDVNGDNFGDVGVGAPFYDNMTLSLANAGRAYVFHGTSGGVSSFPNWIGENGASQSLYGFSIAKAGNINNDPFGDIIVSARDYQSGLGPGTGAAYVYLGSSGCLISSPVCNMEGPHAGAMLGSSVSGNADVNLDGIDDLLVGVEGFSTGQNGQGRAEVYYGNSCSPVPQSVQLSYFDANWTNHYSNVKLRWKIEGEAGVDQTIIERSLDGNFWGEAGIGQQLGGPLFGFDDGSVDSLMIGDEVFYRLKFVYQDGRIDYSFVKSLTKHKQFFSFVYPNPSKGHIQLGYQGDAKELKLQIFDLNQNLLWQGSKTKRENQGTINIQAFEDWPPGLYILKVHHKLGTDSFKIIKQN